MVNLRFGRFHFWWLLLPALGGLLLLGAYILGWRLPLVAGDLHPTIVYIGHDTSGRPQLFRTDVGDGRTTTRQLTDIQDSTLLDFAFSPNGWPVALSVETAAGGGVWLLSGEGGEVTRLLDCSQAECSSPVWSPDGRRLIYERRELSDEDGTAGPPHLWWLDTITGETIPVLEEDQASAQNARFSPDGQWLSYAIPAEQGIQLFNLLDGRQSLLPSQVGAAAAWSSGSQSLLLSDLELITIHGGDGSDHLAHSHEFEEAIQLYLANVDAESVGAESVGAGRTRLSPQAGVDDGFPAWSPDDQWIAFGRKTPRAQSGRQLWLMRPDGSDSHALTTDPTVQHGPPHWSPDGRYLLFQRYPLLEQGAVPEIWILNVESGETQRVVANGYLPNWMP